MSGVEHMPQRPGFEDFQPESFVFTDANMAAADKIITKYPDHFRSAAVMPLLDIAQRQNDGWLPRAAMDMIADLLGMPKIRVYEVSTFYTMYNLKPMGRHFVQVCTNLPCWLRGSEDVVKTCKEQLGVGNGETTEDGLFSYLEVECLGACVNAPMMQIGDDFFEDLDAASTKSVLDALANGEQPKPGPQNGRKGCEPATGLTCLTGDVRALKDLKAVADRTPKEKAAADGEAK